MASFWRKVFGLGEKQPEDYEILKKFKLFNRLTDKGLKLFYQMLIKRHYKKGECIFKEGYPHVVLYLLLEGEINLLINQDEREIVLATLHPHVHFGEVGLFIDSTRTATAVCTKESVLLAISKEDFLNFVMTYSVPGAKILYELGISLSNALKNSNSRLKENEKS